MASPAHIPRLLPTLTIYMVLSLWIKTASAQYCSLQGFYCASCTNFQVCIDGKPSGNPIPCPSGFACNMDGILECTYGVCSLPTAAPTTTTTTTTTTTPAPTFSCPSQGRFPDPLDSSKYYVCLLDPFVEGRYITMNPSCPPGATFSPTLMRCQQHPTTAPTTTPESISTTEEVTQTSPNPSETAKPEQSTTTNSESPTPAGSTTLQPQETTEQSGATTPNPSSVPPTSSSPSEMTTIAGESTPSNPESSTATATQTVTSPSSATTEPFETTTIAPSSSSSPGSTPLETSPPTEEPVTSTTLPTTTKPPLFECMSKGLFPHPTNCRKYYYCALAQGSDKYVAISFTCKRGLFYSARKRKCVKRRESDCPANGGNGSHSDEDEDSKGDSKEDDD